MLRTRMLLLLAAVPLLQFAAAPALAAPLNLVLLDPDIVSGATFDITYDSTSDMLMMSGFTLSLLDPPTNLSVIGNYSLSAEINDSGALVGSSGTISLTGELAAEGWTSGTLLTGDLTSFGFSGAGAGMVLEFTFNNLGGDMALEPEFAGGLGGTIIGVGSNTFTSWSSDWNNLIFDIPGTGLGASDTAPVPEPSTGLLLAAGLAILGGSRKRRR